MGFSMSGVNFIRNKKTTANQFVVPIFSKQKNQALMYQLPNQFILKQFFALLALVALPIFAQAQDKTPAKKQTPAADTTKPDRPADPYSTPTEFEIGGITVVGAVYTDQNAIQTVSGLTVGKKIKMPGDNIPRAIRNLWNLRLFTDVYVDLDKRIGDIIFISIHVQERPRLSRYSYQGAKKSYHEDLGKEIDRFMQKGTIITDDMKANVANAVTAYYIDHGYLDCKTTVREVADTIQINSARLVVDVNSGSKVRIKEIVFEGNKAVGKGKLARLMKKTKTVGGG
jgi:outer membrane protein insertion porin family